MIKEIYLPEPCLAPYISHYLHLQIKITDADIGNFCSYPHGACMIKINYSDEIPILKNPYKEYQLKSFLCGILTKGLSIQNTGSFKCIIIYLTPLGSYQFFRISQSEILNKLILPDSLFKDWNSVVEKVCNSCSVREKINVINNYFKSKAQEKTSRIRICEALLNYIRVKKGNLRVNELMNMFHTTSRTLDRYFNLITGLPPKPYANLVRLETAYRMLMLNPDISIHDIVYLLGYYDQSHLYREFFRYAVITPSELRTNNSKMQFPKLLIPEA